MIISGIMKVDNIEQVILDPKLIARGYMSTWFLLDLVSFLLLMLMLMLMLTVFTALMFLLRSAPYLSTTSSSSSTACGERQSMFVSFHLRFIVLLIFNIISTICWSSSTSLSVAHIILTTAVFLNLNCFEKWIFVSSSQEKSLFWGSKSLSHRTCGMFTSNYWYLMHFGERCLIVRQQKLGIT